MTPAVRNALIAFLTAAVVLITAIITQLGGDTPNPEPTPTPTVSPSPSPTPIPADLVLRGSRGEVLGTRLELSPSSCVPIQHDSDDFTPQFFRIGYETTTHRSYAGAALGDYPNGLYPVTDVCVDDEIWMDLPIPRNMDAGDYLFTVNGVSVSVRVWSMTMPETFSLPAYSAISTWGVLQAHYGNPPGYGGSWSDEWRIGERYVQAAIEHAFYPFGFTPTNRVQNATEVSRMLQYSPGWFWVPIRGPNSRNGSPGFDWSAESLQAAEAITHARDKVIYVYDEPRGLGNVPTADMQASIAFIREHAPSLSIFITMNYETAVPIDIGSPVFEYLPTRNPSDGAQYGNDPYPEGHRVCGYVSCMTSGCGEGGQLTGTPGFEVELAPVYRRSIAWIAHHMGLECFLYYHMNVEFGNRRSGESYSLWHYEGGNGDGQVFGPPDLEAHMPVVTMRMKEWREAAYDYEYLRWANADVSALVQSTRSWSKDYGAYQTMRDQIGENLNGR